MVNSKEKNKYLKEYREKNKEDLRKKQKEYYEIPEVKEKYKKRAKEYYDKHPDRLLQLKKEQHIRELKNYPEKVKVWKNSYRKRKDKCQVCGSKDNLEFHHTDYIKNEGITLCRKCHKNLHNTIKMEENKHGKPKQLS